MLVLALDTTTASGSCALARDGRIVREQASGTVNAHAERLPAELMDLLDASGIALHDVDAFAVATGPGSFTGLRIGIATMQGLAFAEGKPLVGISGFDALVHIAGHEGRVATWVDAWRGEVFAALYDEGREIEPPIVSPPEQILDRMRGHRTRFVGDGAVMHQDVIRRVLGDDGVLADSAPPLAGTIAGLAHAALSAGERPVPHAIRPLYVKRIDAELARHARSVR